MRVNMKKWFIALSDLRGKERSLLHGDYYPLFSSDSSLSFLRLWDQSERYITAVNWGSAPETLTLPQAPTGKLNRYFSQVERANQIMHIRVDF